MSKSIENIIKTINGVEQMSDKTKDILLNRVNDPKTKVIMKQEIPQVSNPIMEEYFKN